MSERQKVNPIISFEDVYPNTGRYWRLQTSRNVRCVPKKTVIRLQGHCDVDLKKFRWDSEKLVIEIRETLGLVVKRF